MPNRLTKQKKNCDSVDGVLHIGLNFRPCFQKRNMLVLLVIFLSFYLYRKNERERERERKRKQNLKNRIKFDKDIADLNEFI